MQIEWDKIEFSSGARTVWTGAVNGESRVSVFWRLTGWWYRIRGQRPHGPFGTDVQAREDAEKRLAQPEVD